MRRLAAFACIIAVATGCSNAGTDNSSVTSAGPAVGITQPGVTQPGVTQPSIIDTVPPASTTTPATTTTTTTNPVPLYAASIDELLAIGRPIVLAHTAGEDQFPASTLYGFAESVKAGVDMLDLNLLLTKDGVLIVQHDDTVDRSTNGTGAVADLTYIEVAALDDAYWFTADCGACTDRPEGDYLYRGIRTGDRPPPDGYTPDDFAIPTFRQVVERFPDIPLNIEIKGSGAPAMAAADQLLLELDELDRADASVVASFDDAIVSYFHGIAPDVEVSPGLGVLTAYVLDGIAPPDGMRILQLPPEYSGLQVITPELVARASADGYPIWVWPNNRLLENYDAYLAFLQQGVAGLNINFPQQGVDAVREFVTAGADDNAPPTT